MTLTSPDGMSAIVHKCYCPATGEINVELFPFYNSHLSVADEQIFDNVK